jgi:hypothetical protein
MIIEAIILLMAIPLGFLLTYLTKEEKQIYKSKQYFPTLLWIIAIAATVFWTLNKTIALTLTFIFIMTFVWNKK